MGFVCIFHVLTENVVFGCLFLSRNGRERVSFVFLLKLIAENYLLCDIIPLVIIFFRVMWNFAPEEPPETGWEAAENSIGNGDVQVGIRFAGILWSCDKCMNSSRYDNNLQLD